MHSPRRRGPPALVDSAKSHYRFFRDAPRQTVLPPAVGSIAGTVHPRITPRCLRGAIHCGTQTDPLDHPPAPLGKDEYLRRLQTRIAVSKQRTPLPPLEIPHNVPQEQVVASIKKRVDTARTRMTVSDYLDDASVQGTVEIAEDAAITLGTQPGDVKLRTAIPPQYHELVELSQVDVSATDPEDLIALDGRFYERIFPKWRPFSQLQTAKLSSTLQRMLADLPRKPIPPSRDGRYLCQVAGDELNVLHMVMKELVRQISVHNSQRASILEAVQERIESLTRSLFSVVHHQAHAIEVGLSEVQAEKVFGSDRLSKLKSVADSRQAELVRMVRHFENHLDVQEKEIAALKEIVVQREVLDGLARVRETLKDPGTITDRQEGNPGYVVSELRSEVQRLRTLLADSKAKLAKRDTEVKRLTAETEDLRSLLQRLTPTVSSMSFVSSIPEESTGTSTLLVPPSPASSTPSDSERSTAMLEGKRMQLLEQLLTLKDDIQCKGADSDSEMEYPTRSPISAFDLLSIEVEFLGFEMRRLRYYTQHTLSKKPNSHLLEIGKHPLFEFMSTPIALLQRLQSINDSINRALRTDMCRRAAVERFHREVLEDVFISVVNRVRSSQRSSNWLCRPIPSLECVMGNSVASHLWHTIISKGIAGEFAHLFSVNYDAPPSSKFAAQAYSFILLDFINMNRMRDPILNLCACLLSGSESQFDRIEDDSDVSYLVTYDNWLDATRGHIQHSYPPCCMYTVITLFSLFCDVNNGELIFPLFGAYPCPRYVSMEMLDKLLALILFIPEERKSNLKDFIVTRCGHVLDHRLLKLFSVTYPPVCDDEARLVFEPLTIIHLLLYEFCRFIQTRNDIVFNEAKEHIGTLNDKISWPTFFSVMSKHFSFLSPQELDLLFDIGLMKAELRFDSQQAKKGAEDVLIESILKTRREDSAPLKRRPSIVTRNLERRWSQVDFMNRREDDDFTYELSLSDFYGILVTVSVLNNHILFPIIFQDHGMWVRQLSSEESKLLFLSLDQNFHRIEDATSRLYKLQHIASVRTLFGDSLEARLNLTLAQLRHLVSSRSSALTTRLVATDLLLSVPWLFSILEAGKGLYALQPMFDSIDTVSSFIQTSFEHGLSRYVATTLQPSPRAALHRALDSFSQLEHVAKDWIDRRLKSSYVPNSQTSRALRRAIARINQTPEPSSPSDTAFY